jgi:hypothetical protein
MDYQQKYVKYKQKYLNKTNQIGGNRTIIIDNNQYNCENKQKQELLQQLNN